jgi:hypothetical protein
MFLSLPAAVSAKAGAAEALTETSAAESLAAETVETNARTVTIPAAPVRSVRSVAALTSLRHMAIGESTRLAVPVDRGEELLDLTRFTNLTPGARVVSVDADGEEHPIDMSGVVLLRGTIAGDPDSIAFIAITPGQVSGFIQAADGIRIISSGQAGAGDAVRSAMATELKLGDGSPICAVDTNHPGFYPRGQVPPAPSTLKAIAGGARGTIPCRVARIAVDSDYEFTADLFGGNAALAAAYIQTLMAASSMVFERDVNVRLAIPYIRVFTANNDPYASNDGTVGFLFEMRDHWNFAMRHIPREAVHGLSGRPLGGGVAYVNALCNSQFGHGVSANMNGSFPMPVIDNSGQNWDLMVVSHELGHNFGTGHTHDAYEPVIDGCGNGDCSTSFDSTIMSYCHTCPGGLSNMDMRFHPRVQARILEFLDNIACDLTTGSGVQARDDAFEVLAGVTTPLDLLSNDAAASCDNPGVLNASFPSVTFAGGTLTAEPAGGPGQTGRLLYTSPAGFSGPDAFTYTLASGQIATVSLDVLALRQPVIAGPTEPGVEVSYYALNSPSLMPDFDTLTPFSTEIVPQINVASTGGVFAGSGLSDNVGAVYEALFEVPASGWYQIGVESDDGSLLYIDGDLLVDNDGLHGMQDRRTFVPLAAGKHALRVEFFEAGGGAGIIVRSLSAQNPYRPIPASSLFRSTGADCPADLAEPFGTLNFSDLLVFLGAFNAQQPQADLAEPFGDFNFFDVLAYIQSFNGGCP